MSDLTFKPTNGVTKEIIEAFKQAGFSEKLYPGQDEVFLSKDLLLQELPKKCNELVDEESIFPESKAIVEICPDGSLQLCLLDTDDVFYISYNPLFERQSWRALAKDAGVVLV